MRIEFLCSWRAWWKTQGLVREYQKGEVGDFPDNICGAIINRGYAKAVDKPPRDKMMRMVKNK